MKRKFTYLSFNRIKLISSRKLPFNVAILRVKSIIIKSFQSLFIEKLFSFSSLIFLILSPLRERNTYLKRLLSYTKLDPSYRFANLPHEIDMHGYCRDGKEEIEMQSLENCPHIVGNPLNSMPYHPYATVTSLSSLQSYPRRNVSRNPSIISNPLDNYYVDNELGVYRLNRDMMPRVSSNANLESFHTSHDEMSFRVPVDENENLQHANRNNERRQQTVEQQVVRNAGNELMNTRNRARSVSRLSQDSRRSSLNREVDQHQAAAAFVRLPDPEEAEASSNGRVDEDQRPWLYRNDQNARNPRLDHAQVQDEVNRNVVDGDLRYFPRNRRLEDEDRSQREAEGAQYLDEEAGNFGALADIRESRV